MVLRYVWFRIIGVRESCAPFFLIQIEAFFVFVYALRGVLLFQVKMLVKKLL